MADPQPTAADPGTERRPRKRRRLLRLAVIAAVFLALYLARQPLFGAWLDEHPDARVNVLCPRLKSARWRYLLGRGVAAGTLGRVRLRAVAHPEYDETSWWRWKHGQLDVFNNLVGYAHVRLCGETP